MQVVTTINNTYILYMIIPINVTFKLMQLVKEDVFINKKFMTWMQNVLVKIFET